MYFRRYAILENWDDGIAEIEKALSEKTILNLGLNILNSNSHFFFSGSNGVYARDAIYLPKWFIESEWNKTGTVVDHYRALLNQNITRKLATLQDYPGAQTISQTLCDESLGCVDGLFVSDACINRVEHSSCFFLFFNHQIGHRLQNALS